ncbi:hypothetical protein [Clostridium butyricum]
MKKYEYELLNDDVNTVLNELADEYKELLITNIVKEKQYTNLEEVNIRDVINEDNMIKNIMLEKKIQRKKERLLRITISMGLVYSIIGVSMYLFMNTDFIDDMNNKMPIIVVLIGLFASAFGLLMKELPVRLFSVAKAEERRSNEISNGFDLIEKWNEIEGLLYSINNLESIDKVYIPIGKLISHTISDGIINEEDKKQIKNILKTRNSLVHHTENKLSYDEIRNSLKEADYIIEKLKKY